MWMGSTNRPDVLDPALTRSGRLDTKIAVDPPDRTSRRFIIEGYLSRIKHDDTVDVESIVADTNGLTPADISGAITKDAVRIAFFDRRKLVGQKDIDKAFLEQQAGMETPVEEMEEAQRRVLAYHEAGHAIAQYYVMPDQKIVRVTIVKLSSGSQGHMAPVDTVEQHVRPIMHYAYEIIVAMAGRGSEKVLTGEMFDSVGGDYPMVRMLMWRLVESGFFGPPLAGGPTGPMGASYDQYLSNKEKTLEKYWLTMEEATEKLLRQHWREVTALAEELLVKSTLSGKEVVEIIEANQTPEALHGNIVPRTLAAIRAQALAEVRSGYSGDVRQALAEPARGSATINGVSPEASDTEADEESETNEEVIVINGNGNGSAAANGSRNGAQRPEPEVVSNGAGSYEPRLANEDEPRQAPQLVNDEHRAQNSGDRA
jgi:hypothetical protein